MKILVAEDDLTSRRILSSVLGKIGHETVETSDGLSALAVLESPDCPRLAVLDWMMPGMDGPEVIRRVREKGNDRPPYIIMLTTRGSKEDIIAGLGAGANDYLAKPFDTGELQARVEVGRRMVELQDALVESREALAYQAAHDSLTGLLNRRAILDRLAAWTMEARDGHVAVGLLDIDHFKRVNDTLGHQAGDEVLRRIASVMKEFCGADGAGRMGGEEFLALRRPGGNGDPFNFFDSLRERIAKTSIKTETGTVSVTASIGVALAAAGTAEGRILTAADDALYRAKNLGRNRVERAF